MRQSLTYSVDISWSELIDFLDESYVNLLLGEILILSLVM